MAFDINQFLNVSYEQEFQTKRELLPVGDYIAYIKGLDVQLGNRPGSLNARLTFLIDDPELQKELNRDEVLLLTSLFLDVDPNDPNILLYGVNQNLTLGRIRAALGQNVPGVPWNFSQLEGAGPMLIHVEHRAQTDKETKKPTGDVFENITKYAQVK